MKKRGKVISAMAIWFILQLGLFFFSAYLTCWQFKICLHGRAGVVYNRVNADAFTDDAYFFVSSKRVLFPFPANGVYDIVDYKESFTEFISEKVDAFDVRTYDWTDLLFYSLLPTLGLMAFEFTGRTYKKNEGE